MQVISQDGYKLVDDKGTIVKVDILNLSVIADNGHTEVVLGVFDTLEKCKETIRGIALSSGTYTVLSNEEMSKRLEMKRDDR